MTRPSGVRMAGVRGAILSCTAAGDNAGEDVLGGLTRPSVAAAATREHALPIFFCPSDRLDECWRRLSRLAACERKKTLVRSSPKLATEQTATLP